MSGPPPCPGSPGPRAILPRPGCTKLPVTPTPPEPPREPLRVHACMRACVHVCTCVWPAALGAPAAAVARSMPLSETCRPAGSWPGRAQRNIRVWKVTIRRGERSRPSLGSRSSRPRNVRVRKPCKVRARGNHRASSHGNRRRVVTGADSWSRVQEMTLRRVALGRMAVRTSLCVRVPSSVTVLSGLAALRVPCAEPAGHLGSVSL